MHKFDEMFAQLPASGGLQFQGQSHSQSGPGGQR